VELADQILDRRAAAENLPAIEQDIFIPTVGRIRHFCKGIEGLIAGMAEDGKDRHAAVKGDGIVPPFSPGNPRCVYGHKGA